MTREKVQELENEYAAPAVGEVSSQPYVKQSLIPQKDDTFVSFGNFSDIKKDYSIWSFYPLSLLVCLVMCKTFWS